ncbi:hypothetical protein A7982_13302 [Minicystis rosea]|nr:hypothetical protein A7982_13302 [Minicystis rosea]
MAWSCQPYSEDATRLGEDIAEVGGMLVRLDEYPVEVDEQLAKVGSWRSKAN